MGREASRGTRLLRCGGARVALQPRQQLRAVQLQLAAQQRDLERGG